MKLEFANPDHIILAKAGITEIIEDEGCMNACAHCAEAAYVCGNCGNRSDERALVTFVLDGVERCKECKFKIK